MNMNSTNIKLYNSYKKYHDIYHDHFIKYINEYGENTAIFLQVGYFYEFFRFQNYEDYFSKLCNILLLNQVNIGNNSFAGFPISNIKHITTLLNNYNTIIFINKYQDEIKTNIFQRQFLMESQLQNEIKTAYIERQCRPDGQLYFNALNNFNNLLNTFNK